MPKKLILVVDDTDEIRTLVAQVLTSEGYEVACAANGREALAAVEREEPALILLDLHMPVLDSWGFARALKERAMHLTIVVVTAGAHARRYAREVGAAGYVSKPFDLADLLDTVERLCAT